MFSFISRPPAVAATAAITLVLLAGCGNDSGGTDNTSSSDRSTSPSAPAAVKPETGFNPQDAAFARNMIHHHRQALDMASIAADRKASPAVAGLAAKIQATQQPEIDTMSGWLRAWGKEVLAEGMSHGAGPNMPGMMTGEQMDELNGAEGADFDTLFLKMMIEHHQGAITMAKAEQAGGKNSDAKTLAEKVIAGQSAEITAMQILQQG